MTNVLEYLEASAERDGHQIAVCDGTKEYTRSQLLDLSRRVGSALSTIAKRRSPVIVFMEKNVDTITAFFGSVYAGAFYCLIDPSLPPQRQKQIRCSLAGSERPAPDACSAPAGGEHPVTDACSAPAGSERLVMDACSAPACGEHPATDACVVLTDSEHLARAKEVFESCRILEISSLQQCEPDPEGLGAVRARHLDTDPLYVNFTSGSTGVPKGVLICHRSVIDFINVFVRQFGIREDDVIANQAPLDFDVSVKDIYSAMLTGAKLVLVPRPLFTTPAPLLDFLCEQNTTVMIWAVSALTLVSAFHGLDYRVPDKVRMILFSGEVMPLKRLKDWMDHLPDTEFVNLYGPTEITCNCTWHRIDRTRDYPDGIPIGRSFENEETFLLDDKDREITQPGVTGEICVRGTAVGLGYWNMEEQTRERFRKDPRTPQYASIIYCTGDLGCYNAEGELLFRGRKDDQIKYMGHRIELAEVELAINRIPGVDRSCCIFDEKKDRLHGFYCGSIARKDLALALKQQLPVFMIPGILHPMDALPVTGRGKIDRKALKELIAPGGGRSGRSFV